MAARDVELILNRRARRLASDGAIARALLEAARAEGIAVHETTSLESLDRIASAMVERRPRAVVLAGGDGSYMAGATALARAFGAFDGGETPPVALAPGGTVSTVLRNWGGPRAATAEGARRLIRAVARGDARATRRPSLRVTDDRGGDRVGFIFGAGLVASFFDEYYASARQGYAGAAAIVGRIFAQSFVGGPLARRVLTPVAATLAIDGRAQRPEAWSLIVATVVRDLGLHMIVARHAGERADAFHAVASPLGPAQLGPQMPLVLAGRRLLGADHVDAPLTRELRLAFPDEGGYVLDGDVLRARALRVTPGPTLTVLSA